MWKTFAWLGGAGLLVLGCGDDSSVTPTDESSSAAPETTTGMGVTSTGPVDPSTTGQLDSSGSSTSDGGATTTVAESSTGPVEACGNDVIDGDDVCDGNDLGGQDCVMQGFTSGTVSCALNCGAIDTSDCGTCGNVIVDGDEVCDDFLLLGQSCESQGFSSGQLGCTPDCLTYDVSQCITCGNDLIDGVEPCDGVDLGGADCISEGYVAGTLACTADCAFDISGCNTCGNAAVDPGEGCDGANLNGQTCASLGLTGGVLSCAPSCQYDFSGCEVPGLPFGSDTGYTGYVIQGAPLPCDNIVGTGTPTNLTDDSNIVVPIGFTFPFYGVDYTDANLQSNGVLRFGDILELSFTNSCLPSATAPATNNLYVFWDDLNPATGGDVYYQTLGAVGNRRFVVQWEIAHFGGDAVDLIRVQAMLDEATGQINVCYPDTLSVANIGNNGAEATSGIQQSSVSGFDYSCNMPSLTNGTLLLYIPL